MSQLLGCSKTVITEDIIDGRVYNMTQTVPSTSGAGKTKSNGPKTNELPHTEKNEVVTLPHKM